MAGGDYTISGNSATPQLDEGFRTGDALCESAAINEFRTRPDNPASNLCGESGFHARARFALNADVAAFPGAAATAGRDDARQEAQDSRWAATAAVRAAVRRPSECKSSTARTAWQFMRGTP